MTEEIKEILDIFKQVYEDNNNGIKYEDFNTGYMKIPTVELYPGDCKLLYDYITNLQNNLEVSKTNEETYRLEMQEITKIFGLDEHTLFDDVKEYATNLQQDLDKANDIIIKDRQFNQGRLLDVVKLKEENKRLKEEKQRLLYNLEKVCEEDEEDYNPYCETCGTCGYIGCCGIRNFISEHIEGKTNCKNESLIISELINLCEYKDEVYQEKEDYKSRCEKAIEYINHENFKRAILVGVSTKKYTRNILDNVLNILNGSDENE